MKRIKARTFAGLICGAMMVMSSVYGMTDSSKDATVYVIKQGDTLWSIAVRFNANPWLWPKLWEQNKYITNPHLIYPGEQITLLPSSVGVPLTGMAAAVPMTSSAAQPAEEAAQMSEQGITTPTVEAEEQPEEQAPPSIQTATPYGIQFASVAANTYVYPSLGSSGFLAKEKLAAAGEIIAAQTRGRTIFGEHDIVFINLGSNAGVKKGDQFSIYKKDKKIYDPESDDFLGYRIKIMGVLKVTEVGARVSTAEIVSSYEQVRIHDRLASYEPGTKTIDMKLASDPIKGYVVCGKTDQRILGENNVVYIDRGSNSGVQVGNTFVIYRDRKPVEDPATGRTLHLPKEVLGKLLVISVHGDTSVAIITKSVREIERGDRILADTASGII